MATSWPSTFTPTNSPSWWVREKNGPGAVRAARATICGESASARGWISKSTGSGWARVCGDHLVEHRALA